MKSIVKNLLGIILLLGIASFFMVSPQIYKHSLIVSNDWLFHMNRFYETAMQIQHHTFNYFQSLYGFNQTGRVINAMYGTDFAYLNGFLLLLLKNWFRFQIVSVFSCFFVSGLTMYLLTRYCQLSKKISLAAAILYMGTPVIVYYTVAQNFSGWGAAFLPLVFIPAIRMIRNHQKPINPAIFGLTISILLSVHMFSSLLAVVAVVPFFIAGFFKSHNRMKMIREAILSVLVAIGLSFNTFTSFLDLSQDRLVSPHSVVDMMSNSTVLSYGPMGWTVFGLIFSLIFVFQIFFSFVNWKKMSLIEKMINSVGMFFLFFSSRYFPWNELGERFNFLQKMQFPQRFSAVACILLILGFTLTIQRLSNTRPLKESYQVGTIIILVFAALSSTGGYTIISDAASAWNSDKPLSRDTGAAEILETDADKIRKAFGGSSELSEAFKVTRKPTSDYLPIYTKKPISSYDTYKTEIFDNKLEPVVTVSDKNELVYTFTSQEEQVTVPTIIYHNSTIELNGKTLKKADFSLSPIGALKIKPKTVKNQVVIGYQPALLFKLSFIVRLATLAIIVSYFIKTRYSKKHFTSKD